VQAWDTVQAKALVLALPPTAGLVRDQRVEAAWDRPSDLAGYTVGGVAGHLVRAAGRLEQVLDLEPSTGERAELTDWYLANRFDTPGDLGDELAQFLRDDGEELSRKGAPALADELDALAVRLQARLQAEPADRDVNALRTTKPVTLSDYLASRVLEVVVHADDVATGAGVELPDLGPLAMDVATQFLLQLARARSGDLPVVRALTRAGRVADPYEVLRVL
jgi:uncharacterized protein (TIGR03083 family)